MTHFIGQQFPIPQEQQEQDIDEATELLGEEFAEQLAIEYGETKSRPMIAVDVLIVLAFTLGVGGGILLGIEIAIRLGL